MEVVEGVNIMDVTDFPKTAVFSTEMPISVNLEIINQQKQPIRGPTGGTHVA